MTAQLQNMIIVRLWNVVVLSYGVLLSSITAILFGYEALYF